MAIGVIFGIIFGALCVACVVATIVIGVRWKPEKKPRDLSNRYGELSEADIKEYEARLAIHKRDVKLKRNVMLSTGIGILVFFFLFLCISFSWHTVDAGEVAVVKHLGEVKQVRTAGTYFDFWMTEKYEKYDAKVQTLEIQESAYSSDKQTMDISMTVQYQIMPEKAKEIAMTYGNLETLSNRIRSVSIERAKAELSAHSADQIIENRASMSPTVQQTVKEAISDNYFVTINAVVLTNIDFSDAYEKIVEETMMAKQEETKAEYEKKVAIINAQKELEVAQLAAQAKLYAAQQDAEAQKAIADAEAYATQIKIVELARSLGYEVIEHKDAEGVVKSYEVKWDSDPTGKETLLNYLQYLEYLAKWDGKLPEVVGDGSGFMITIPGSSKVEE